MSISLFPCSKFTRIWRTPFAKDLVPRPQQHSDSKPRWTGERLSIHLFSPFISIVFQQKSKKANVLTLILGSSLDKFILRILGQP